MFTSLPHRAPPPRTAANRRAEAIGLEYLIQTRPPERSRSFQPCAFSHPLSHRPSSAEPWDWPEVARFCERQTRRWLGPGEDSRDAAQEAALRAWRMRHQCTTPAEPWGWLARISQREAARLAARRREILLADAHALEAPAPGADLLGHIAVQAAVADLAPLDRTLIALRYEHDQTYERIAELVSLPEGTVKVRLHRARHRLRGVLADHRVST